MADLTTKTLGQVETVTEVGSTDNVLLESSGVMKKIAASSIGGGGGTETVIIDQYADPITANRSFQEVLNLLNSGVPVIACATGTVLGTGFKHFMMLYASGTNIYGNYVSFDPFNNGMFGESFQWTENDGIMYVPFDYVMTPAT